MLMDMEENGPEPNIYTYNNIVRVFAEAGKLERAMSILKNINRRKLVRHFNHYYIFIHRIHC